MKSKNILGTSLSYSKDFSKGFSKEISTRRSNQSIQLPKDYALETKDRALFGLCSYEDINKYFNDLCKEGDSKISAVKKLADYTKYSVNKGRSSKILNGRSSGQTSPVSSLVRAAFKATSKSNTTETGWEHVQEAQSPTRKKNVEFTVVWSQLDEEALELLKEFGVSQATLTSLETEEEKQNYIITTMRRKLDEEFEKWKKDVEKTEKDIQKYEQTNEQKKLKFEKEKADVFKWLRLKTKFPFLKKKLKLELMEILNDVNNQKDIEKSLDEIRTKDKSMITSGRRITLENVPSVNNAEILADVLGNNDSIFKIGKAYRLNKNYQKSQQGSFAFPDNTQSFHSPKNSGVFSFNTFHSPRHSKDFTQTLTLNTEPATSENLSRQHKLSTEGEDVAKGSHYVWDHGAENEFREHKEQARSRLFNDIKSSSWNEVGLAPFIEVSNKKEKQKSHRNNLLERYRKGEALTIEEYATISHTSQLLNSYSDQHFIQSVVNQLDSDIVDAVEIDLAQRILHDYQKSRSQVQLARMEYLKTENAISKRRVQENDQALQINQRIKLGRAEQQRMLKEMTQKVESYERHQNRRKTLATASTSFANAQPLGETITPKAPESKPLHRRLSLKTQKNLVIDVKYSKRANHPSSQLLVLNEERPKEFLGLVPGTVDPKLFKRQNEDPKEFALQIHSSPSLKNKNLFSRYYSGGPPDFEYQSASGYHSHEMPKFKGSGLEHKVATLLKSHIKGHLERQKFLATKRHIMEDRKVVRRLKNNGDGLPDVLRAVFLALTEDKADTGANKKEDSNKIKAMIRELQQKDPFLFRQFQREVIKQYGSYQMTHHRNRNTLISKADLVVADEEKRSLITSLKNAMIVVQNKTQFNSIVLDDDSEQPLRKNNTEGSPRASFERRNVTTPTMVFGTLMAMNDEIKEKEQIRANIRPRTTVKKGTLQQSGKTAAKDDFLVKEGPELPKTSSLEKEIRSFGSIPLGASKASSYRKLRDKQQKIEAATKKKVEKEPKKIAEKLKNKESKIGLSHKQRKLLTAAKTNNLYFVKASGFSYFETDVNLRDEKNNTPLYYTAKAGNLEFCQYLTNLHARVNDPCEKGNTPLHMAFKSDNEGVIMLLLVNGGNLNMLNDEGFTPLAYGSERVINLLDLKSGVATFNKQGNAMRELPEEYDNNHLLKRVDREKSQEDSFLK